MLTREKKNVQSPDPVVMTQVITLNATLWPRPELKLLELDSSWLFFLNCRDSSFYSDFSLL